MNERILEDAERLFDPAQPTAPIISEYDREQQSIRANHQRLRAERLARESNRIASAVGRRENDLP